MPKLKNSSLVVWIEALAVKLQGFKTSIINNWKVGSAFLPIPN